MVVFAILYVHTFSSFCKLSVNFFLSSQITRIKVFKKWIVNSEIPYVLSVTRVPIVNILIRKKFQTWHRCLVFCRLYGHFSYHINCQLIFLKLCHLLGFLCTTKSGHCIFFSLKQPIEPKILLPPSFSNLPVKRNWNFSPSSVKSPLIFGNHGYLSSFILTNCRGGVQWVDLLYYLKLCFFTSSGRFHHFCRSL